MSITGPAGFEAAGVAAGIKRTGALDLALVVNRGPSRAGAAVFTSNRAKANPMPEEPPVTRARPRIRDVVGRVIYRPPARIERTTGDNRPSAVVVQDCTGQRLLRA